MANGFDFQGRSLLSLPLSPDAPGNPEHAGAVMAIMFVDIDGNPITNFGNNDVYSQAEVETNRVWMGSPIYRKVIPVGPLSSATITVPHGITGITQLFPPRGFASSSSTDTIPLPGFGQDPVSVLVDAMNIVITPTSDLSSYTTSFITLEYTK